MAVVHIRIDGLIIQMYQNDHQPPHVHIWHSGDECQIDINTGEVWNLRRMNRKALKKAQAWVEANKAMLLAEWNENQRGV